MPAISLAKHYAWELYITLPRHDSHGLGKYVVIVMISTDIISKGRTVFVISNMIAV